MSPGNHRFVKTALAILGLRSHATVWIALFMFVKPAKGETVDARKVYVIDGDTIALARERIRLLAIDAPETRDARWSASASVRRVTRRRPASSTSCGLVAWSISTGMGTTSMGERLRTSSLMAGISVSSSCARSWRCRIGQARRRKPHGSLSGALARKRRRTSSVHRLKEIQFSPEELVGAVQAAVRADRGANPERSQAVGKCGLDQRRAALPQSRRSRTCQGAPRPAPVCAQRAWGLHRGAHCPSC